VSFTPRPLYPRRKNPSQAHWIGVWVGLRADLDVMETRKFFTLPGLELRPFGRPGGGQLLYRLHYPGFVYSRRVIKEISTARYLIVAFIDRKMEIGRFIRQWAHPGVSDCAAYPGARRMPENYLKRNFSQAQV
jgi:hypothetical protein